MERRPAVDRFRGSALGTEDRRRRPREERAERGDLVGALAGAGACEVGAADAHLAKEALEEAFPVRRCTRAMGASTRFAPCALAGIGRCPAPCDGRIDPDGYADLVGALRASIAAQSGILSV
ncbi:MAG: hypothetical protein ACKO8G_07155, partial [Actinomycetota bacterium]